MFLFCAVLCFSGCRSTGRGQGRNGRRVRERSRFSSFGFFFFFFFFSSGTHTRTCFCWADTRNRQTAPPSPYGEDNSHAERRREKREATKPTSLGKPGPAWIGLWETCWPNPDWGGGSGWVALAPKFRGCMALMQEQEARLRSAQRFSRADRGMGRDWGGWLGGASKQPTQRNEGKKKFCFAVAGF